MTPTSPLFTRLMKSPKLPSVPAVAVRLLEQTRDPDTNPKDIANTIKMDPGLAVKILKSANSSYFSFKSEVRTIEQALPLIGGTAITSLALSFSLANEAITDERVAKHYQRYWLQSIVQASAAECLAKSLGSMHGSEFFMTCLLIDLGQLALLKVLRNEYLPFLDSAEQCGRLLHDLEGETLKFSHVDVGYHLMTEWKLPAAMVQATQFHHGSIEELDALTDGAPLARAAAMAATVGDYFCGSHPGPALLRLRELGERFFKLDQRALSTFLNQVDQRAKAVGELLSTSTAELSNADDLMAQACDQLAELSVQQEAERRESAARQHQMESEKQKLETQNEQLKQQVLRDPLTGVYNRRFFDEVLTNDIRRSCREKEALAVLFIDADHFKKINDNYGHKFGDQVLMKIASTLQDNVRGSDTVARYGGEEFVILTAHVNEQGIKIFAERIRAAIEAENMMFGSERVVITVSIGAAIAVPTEGDENFFARLVETADAAMYESKRRGRNRATIHSLTSDFERDLAHMSGQCRLSHWLLERKIIDSALMYDLAQKARPGATLVGELAVDKQWLTREDQKRILEAQEQSGERFGSIANQLKLLTERQVGCLLAEQAESAELAIQILVKQGAVEAAEGETLLDCFLAERTEFVDATLKRGSEAVPAAHESIGTV